MSTLLRNKIISKTKPLRKENPFSQFNVASHKRPGIRLCFEYTTTLLSGEGGEGRTGTAMMFRKMLSKYTIFSTVLSKIVAIYGYIWCSSCDLCFLIHTNMCVMKWSENVMSFNIKHDCNCLDLDKVSLKRASKNLVHSKLKPSFKILSVLF